MKGYTLENTTVSWGKMALDWNPQVSRGRGKPRNAWNGTVIEETDKEGRTWSDVKKLARNGDQRKHLVTPLCR